MIRISWSQSFFVHAFLLYGLSMAQVIICQALFAFGGEFGGFVVLFIFSAGTFYYCAQLSACLFENGPQNFTAGVKDVVAHSIHGTGGIMALYGRISFISFIGMLSCLVGYKGVMENSSNAGLAFALIPMGAAAIVYAYAVLQQTILIMLSKTETRSHIDAFIMMGVNIYFLAMLIVD